MYYSGVTLFDRLKKVARGSLFIDVHVTELLKHGGLRGMALMQYERRRFTRNKSETLSLV